MDRLTDTKTEKIAEIIKQVYPNKIERLLVVGCGNGVEAAILAQEFNARVTGIDMEASFDERAMQTADLRIGDAMALEFDDETFDFVFSYHALEHIADPVRALREMRRVLKVDGGFWIGTPNRARIVGYIGAKEGSLSEKIRWNLSDYGARLRGRFRNEYGAHAGFTAPELRSLLTGVFGVVNDVSDKYFSTIYSRFGPAVRAVRVRPISHFVYPSVYFTGRR